MSATNTTNAANATNAAALIGSLKESASVFWEARNPRERTTLTAVAALLALLLVYSICLGPALNGRAQLSKELPALRQQALELQQLSHQAAAFKRAGAPAAAPISQESIAASLSAAGMKPQNLAVSDDMVRIQMNPVSFSGLMSWIGEQQRVARLEVIDASFTALPQTDMVNANVTLRQHRSETSNESQ